MKAIKILSTGLVSAAVLLLNPLYACREVDDDFDYTEQSMIDTVTGRYIGFVQAEDGTRTDGVVLEVRQAGAAGAQKCGNRTIVAAAGACVSVTVMTVRVALTRPGSADPVSGSGIALAYETLESWDIEADLGGKSAFLCNGDASGNLACDEPVGAAKLILMRAQL